MILALALSGCEAPAVDPRWLAATAVVGLIFAVRIFIATKDPR